MKPNAARWSIVTFTNSMMCTTMGHYFTDGMWFYIPFVISLIISFLGGFAVSEDKP